MVLILLQEVSEFCWSYVGDQNPRQCMQIGFYLVATKKPIKRANQVARPF